MKYQPTDIFQSSWIVDDIEAAAMDWVKVAGVGPFFVSEFVEGMLENTSYRGTASPITMKTAIAQAGDMQIELVQPTGAGESAYRDTVPAGTTAFHHVAVWTRDIEQDILGYAGKGFDVAARGEVAEVIKFAYVDTSGVLGHMIELVEDNEAIRTMFDIVTAASENWNGSDPLRSFDA